MDEWNAIDPKLTFCPSDLILPADHMVELMRFLISTRHLTTMTSSMASLRPREDSSGDAYLVQLLHLVGSAKEAADRFRCCDSLGMFAVIPESGSEHFDQLKGELAAVRKAVSTDPTSLYNRVLKRVRDEAGFHVDRAAVSGAIERLSSEQFCAAKTTETTAITELPFATAVILSIMWPGRPAPDVIEGTVDGVLEFQRDIRNVAHDYFLLMVRLSTLKRDLVVQKQGEA
jgi:hypothetical protein